MDDFYYLVQRSTTANNQVVFNTAIKMNRNQITVMANNEIRQDSVYHVTSSMAYNNAEYLKEDERFTVDHDVTILPIPTLSPLDAQ